MTDNIPTLSCAARDYHELKEHFNKVMRLKNKLGHCQKRIEILDNSLQSNDNNTSRSIELIRTSQLHYTDKFKRTNHALVEHLKTKRCHSGFYYLMYETSNQVLNWILKNPLLPPEAINSDMSHDDLKALIEDAVKIFHRQISTSFQQDFLVPDIKFVTPHDVQKRKIDLGCFRTYQDGRREIEINNFSEVFNEDPTRALHTAIHESIHSAHSLLKERTTDNEIYPLEHSIYDGLLWDLAIKNYIPCSLSYEAYAAQPMERVAKSVGGRFQQDLEEKIVQAQNSNKKISKPRRLTLIQKFTPA